MSIQNFSKAYFIEVATDIIKHDDFIYPRNVDKLKADTSFREVLDITSLDMAELIFSIEEKFNVNIDDVPIEKIDNINDLYNEFLKCVYRKRQSVVQKRVFKSKVLTK